MVTGANKGIGKEIARQLAGAGLTVYVGSRDAARGERTVEEIGGDARLLVLDVTDAASIAQAASQVDTLDILVNNAGISGDGMTPDREDVDTFRRIYETNVFGVVAATNAFLPALRRSAHPRIVNVSSGTGSLTWANGPQFPHRGTYAAYRSSKGALNALTVYYAHSLADDGIKVNALAPGLRRTDLNVTAAASDGDPAEAGAGAVRLALLPTDLPESSSPGTEFRSRGERRRSKLRLPIDPCPRNRLARTDELHGHRASILPVSARVTSRSVGYPAKPIRPPILPIQTRAERPGHRLESPHGSCPACSRGVAFAERGVRIIALEPDPAMAVVLREAWQVSR